MQSYKNSLPSDSKKPVVVVVEDNPCDQLILRHILEEAGYHVLLDYHGKTGLELLDLCRSEKLNLVAIVSDVQMPIMDGLQFLQEVRKRPETSRIPFMFVTAIKDNLNYEVQKHGASGVLAKPINPRALRQKVQALISGPDQSLSADEMAA